MVALYASATITPEVRRTPGKRTIAGLTRAALGQALIEAGVPERQVRMRIAQLWGWMYVRGVTSFNAMTDVSKDLRARLDQHFSLERPTIVSEQISLDGLPSR